MQKSKWIGILLLLGFFSIEVAAGIQGSRSFFESTASLIGIAIFTALIGVLLVYGCRMDIKHWRKSIDGDAQLGYPKASPADFQLPPMHETSERQTTPQGTDATRRTETTLVERTTQEEKTLRIVKAIYTSSNREVPAGVQKSLQSKGTSHNRTHRPTTLQTISEGTETEHQTTSSKQSKSE